nr:PREDICTED: thymidylate kinase [Tribolium castaneum]|eukprot:XP_008196693.1 PREDICTED: thymidylate kinase [Tribolium castaneum]
MLVTLSGVAKFPRFEHVFVVTATFRNLFKMNGLKRGALIVVEGVDRSGKSTQCRKLVESLKARNVNAALVTFPDRTTSTGGLIDKYLKQETHLCDEAIHLMFTANRWEKKAEMERLLKQGVTLVVDRYSYSGIVYSSVKKNMSVKWCQEPENGLLKPDLVLLLVLSEAEMVKRPNYGSEIYENREMQEKVAQAFRDLSEREKWEVVSADGGVEDVHKELLDKVIKKVSQVGTQPLHTLNFSS